MQASMPYLWKNPNSGLVQAIVKPSNENGKAIMVLTGDHNTSLPKTHT